MKSSLLLFIFVASCGDPKGAENSSDRRSDDLAGNFQNVTVPAELKLTKISARNNGLETIDVAVDATSLPETAKVSVYQHTQPATLAGLKLIANNLPVPPHKQIFLSWPVGTEEPGKRYLTLAITTDYDKPDFIYQHLEPIEIKEHVDAGQKPVIRVSWMAENTVFAPGATIDLGLPEVSFGRLQDIQIAPNGRDYRAADWSEGSSSLKVVLPKDSVSASYRIRIAAQGDLIDTIEFSPTFVVTNPMTYQDIKNDIQQRCVGACHTSDAAAGGFVADQAGVNARLESVYQRTRQNSANPMPPGGDQRADAPTFRDKIARYYFLNR
jgi:hypothetical protein